MQAMKFLNYFFQMEFMFVPLKEIKSNNAWHGT